MEKENKNYQQVLQNEESICFQVELADGKNFLKWAKALGCKWQNGKPIKFNEKTTHFIISMSFDGTIGYVPIFCYKLEKSKSVKKINFSEIKSNLNDFSIFD
ncbi:MAG: hypothetical protein J6V68_04140 [Clostridia bacterium]|nr:hypothetical protein [Clostridia bacterium]